jgi:membrane-associated phospholipid phosphatase
MKVFFKNLIKSLVEIFKWPNIFWHFLAILLTYFIVVFGIDWSYYVTTRFMSNQFWFPAASLGALLPILVPVVLYLKGRFNKNSSLINTALAISQSVMLGWLISSTYKAFTGRIPPNFGETLLDISNGFQFGFWEGGIFWGWPSSHTTIAFAMAASFVTLYPKSKFKYPALIYALYVGLGASVGFHWLSEFVAGAIIGSLIGYVVGKRYGEMV